MDRYGYVLVVEDERDIREPVAELLLQSGYDARTVANGREALELLLLAGTSLPRLILLDLMMPIMDGFEFLRHKSREPALSSIPVCLVTANPPAGTLAADVVSLIRKPIDVMALISVVDRYF